MAPTSRYQTDRRYVMRKPLFAAEQHTSILKKTHRGQREKQLGVCRGEESQQHTDVNFLTRGGGELTPESFSLSRGDVDSPRSASSGDPGSPLRVSELRARLCREEPTFGSHFPGSRSPRQSLSSSTLEVQRLHPPLRPRLTSTVLYPTYTPRSGYSRSVQTGLRLGGREEGSGGEAKLCSSGAHPKGHPMSPYQTNYWACAIPKALPPSPDRHSAGWDPDKEYQALLDYTYPVRPAQVVSEWDSSEFQGDSLLQTDLNLQDSGIELDHLCSSTSLSGLGLTESSAGQTGERSTLRSPDLQGFTESSDGLPSGTLLSISEPVELSSEASDFSKNRGGKNHYKSDGHQHPTLSSTTAFTRSTSVLPQSRRVCGEVDEEFWPLPEQLEELQLLSRQVREVTARLSRPVTASWESLGPGTTSILSSITLPGKQEAEVAEPGGNNDEGKDETGREDRNAAETTQHGDSAAARSSSGALLEPVRVGLSRSSLREAEALVEQLRGLTLLGSQEDQGQSDSLMQHVQVFCSHLGQLIQRLHAVSEKMELLAGPAVDIDSVKCSLAEYQREASSRQPLASSVLRSGRLLLSCINATSPFLRDTLLLIERQSGALENPR